MIVGTCTIHLDIAPTHSLKEKRRLVKSVVAHVRNRFNVSIAEVDANEYWQSAILGVACVANSRERVHGTLSAVASYVEHLRLDVRLADYEIEIL